MLSEIRSNVSARRPTSKMDQQRLHLARAHTLLSTVPLPASLQGHSGPENRQGWAFSCHSSESGLNKCPRIWKWSARSVRADIRKPRVRAPPGCSVRRSCACVWTRWRSWCRSWWWWRMRPCSRWKTPRPCWQRRSDTWKTWWTTGHDQNPNSILTCPLNTVVCRITVNHFKSFCSLPAKHAGPRVRQDTEITVSRTVHPALLMPKKRSRIV